MPMWVLAQTGQGVEPAPAVSTFPSYLSELQLTNNRQGEGLSVAPGTGHHKNSPHQTTLAAPRDSGVVNFVTHILT